MSFPLKFIYMNQRRFFAVSNFLARPSLHYPTVCVQIPPRAPASSVLTPPGVVSYAVPYAKPIQYSASQLQCENMKHRCKMLDSENQRLMRLQHELVADANRRVEMHVNEIRMLKEDNKKLTGANKELRDLCCFLDDDRQKTRRLAKEWQKFGRYTTHVMKQEIALYQQRLREQESRQAELLNENEELKQLCLYLDEQRQRSFLYRTEDDRESEDLGCGSSERSEDCDETKDFCDAPTINQQKENTLRMISQRIAAFPMNQAPSAESIAHTERLVDYIQSLEERIKQLEGAGQQNGIWRSASTFASDSDERTRFDGMCRAIRRSIKKCTLTTSGTTYASSETDLESAVYVMGDESDVIDDTLEVRSLTRIEEDGEEKEKAVDEVEEQSAQLPPAIAPLSESLLNVSRLSLDDAKSSKSLDETIKGASPVTPSKTSFLRRPRPITSRSSLFGAARKASERSATECGSV
ncbi:hypothetical protein GCK32_009778 [Trichostrongylus colubriformis]|uniref:Coiled-coil domain-containing protein 85A n=1 Tax=Trichostrongylus colubriformis TaxID=6319 RepID=A0AAN8IQE4_TRICO